MKRCAGLVSITVASVSLAAACSGAPVVQPTGRVYTIFTDWSQGRLYEPGNAQPDVSTYRSAYTVEPGGETERVAIQTDDGEQIDTFLADGRRRSLIWGTDLFSQADWENEQFQNQGGG